MEDVGENVAAMHVAVGHVVGVDHAGQLFARRRARTAATSLPHMIIHAAGSRRRRPCASSAVTSQDVEIEQERISKIRARHGMRN